MLKIQLVDVQKHPAHISQQNAHKLIKLKDCIYILNNLRTSSNTDAIIRWHLGGEGPLFIGIQQQLLLLLIIGCGLQVSRGDLLRIVKRWFLLMDDARC